MQTYHTAMASSQPASFTSSPFVPIPALFTANVAYQSRRNRVATTSYRGHRTKDIQPGLGSLEVRDGSYDGLGITEIEGKPQ